MSFPEFKKPTYTYKATVVRIVDADTIDVRIDFGFNSHIFKRLRLLGVDAWETRGIEREKGLTAKQFVEEKLLEVDYKIYVQTEMDGEGKYGRVLAWVWLPTINGTTLLNEELIEKGHGVTINY